MSGGLPAFAAVSSLVSRASPPAWTCTCTWMSGCAWFQVATTLSMLGTQVQKVSLTCWPDAAADELPAVAPAPADVLADVPDAGGAELPDEEQPADSTASAALASAVPI